jgi:hypothetical protein
MKCIPQSLGAAEQWHAEDDHVKNQVRHGGVVRVAEHAAAWHSGSHNIPSCMLNMNEVVLPTENKQACASPHDHRHTTFVALTKEDDCGALLAGTSRSAGAVQVRLRVLRHIPVNDEVNVVHIQPTRCNVCSH